MAILEEPEFIDRSLLPSPVLRKGENPTTVWVTGIGMRTLR